MDVGHRNTLSIVVGSGILIMGSIAHAQTSINSSPVIACKDLLDANVDNVVIEEAIARKVWDGPRTGTGSGKRFVVAPHCQILGTIDGSIGFELLLPDIWQGKFVMGGHGGYGGTLQNQAQDLLAANGSPLERGYATAATDTGHRASQRDASWAIDNVAVSNFIGRGVHRTTEVSKAIISKYYGAESERSYFMGCSGGGFQAILIVQRYPSDFDGVIAVAPALDRVNGAAMRIQVAQSVFPRGDSFDDPTITPESLTLVANSVREKCDGLDGVEDGIVSNPQICSFDIADIPRCQNESLASCLTDLQINALRKINEGAVVDGRQVAPGLPLNSEMDQPAWQEWAVKAPPGRLSPEMPSLVHNYGTQFARNFVIMDPGWTIAGYDFSDWTKKSADALMKFGINDPDLDKFQENGGKLLLSHGWSDPAISALGTIEYFESVERRDRHVRDYLRLYLQPGVLHCRGGTGPDYVDRLTELEQWVEHGNAPQAITAYKRNAQGAVAVERILCPYPQIAEHRGGDSNRAENYRCVEP